MSIYNYNSNQDHMILTCPNCATRYSTKNDAISPNGRTVRCAACETTWFVSADEAIKATSMQIKGVDPDALALKDIQMDTIQALGALTAAGNDTAENTASGTASGNTTPKMVTPHDKGAVKAALNTAGAHVSMRNKADAQKLSQRRKTIFKIWAVPMGLVGFVAAAGILLRQDIVTHIPKSASFYKTLGMSVKKDGLIIENPVVKTALIDGEPVLVINSAVKNVSSKTQNLPLVELSLRNGFGEVLVQWNVELERTRIGSKARIEFGSQFPNPPIEAIKMTYRFAE